MKRRPTTGIVLPAAMLSLAPAGLAHACATCFGDPESNIAKGAASGVMVMAVILYGVMMCMAGTTFLWWRRSRRMDRGAADASREGDD
jgi:hypothetical protein